MNSNQIALIKESYMKEATSPITGKPETAGVYMRLCLDGGLEFVTSKDLCLFDDANELVHCISINEVYQSQTSYPIKIMTTEYAMIQQVETIMSQKSFEEFLDSGFISSLLTDEKKEFIKKWSRDIRNQAIQPIRPTPFFIQEPAIIPMPDKIILRDDEVDTQYPPATLGLDSAASVKTVAVATVEAMNKAIEEANDGDIIVVANDITITEPLTLNNKVISLVSDGATIASPININDAESVMISGFNLDSTSDSNGFAVLGKSNEFVFSNNTVYLSGYRDVIVANCESIIIDNNTFNGDGSVYNVIEIGQSTPIKNLKITGNVFTKNACKNNAISLYNFEENATVNISDNIFEKSANALRITNQKDTNVVIECANNTYIEIDPSAPEYIGFILIQGMGEEDYSKMTINIRNLIGPGNETITENGTGEKQVWYTYNTNNSPVVNFV